MNENPMDNQAHNPAGNPSGTPASPPPPSPEAVQADRIAEDLKRCWDKYQQMKRVASQLAQRADIAPALVDQMNQSADDQLSDCIYDTMHKYFDSGKEEEAQKAGESAAGPNPAGGGASGSAGGSAFHFGNKLYRTEKDKMIAGVCGGLAECMKIDSSIIRVLFVVFSIWPLGLGLIVYLVLAVILPMKTESGEMRRMF